MRQKEAVPFCWWRELLMTLGVGCLLFFGMLVGRAYFNRVLTEIFEDIPDEGEA